MAMSESESGSHQRGGDSLAPKFVSMDSLDCIPQAGISSRRQDRASAQRWSENPPQFVTANFETGRAVLIGLAPSSTKVMFVRLVN